jgi:hypothetical protein
MSALMIASADGYGVRLPAPGDGAPLQPEETLEVQAAQQQPQPAAEELVNKPLNSVIGPPGLTKRGSQRNHPDAAVVMPNDARSPPTIEPGNLHFGSLNLFDSRTLGDEHLLQEDSGKNTEAEPPRRESRCVCCI